RAERAHPRRVGTAAARGTDRQHPQRRAAPQHRSVSVTRTPCAEAPPPVGGRRPVNGPGRPSGGPPNSPGVKLARLVGVDLPREKRLEVALTYIYGVGRTRAKETLAATGISGDVRVKDLGDNEVVALRDYLEANYKLEGDLRREVAADIRRKVEIGCY